MKTLLILLILSLLLSSAAYGIGWLKAQVIDLDKYGDTICVKYHGQMFEITPVVSNGYLKLKLEEVIVK